MNQVEQVRRRVEQIDSDVDVRTAQTPAGARAAQRRRPGDRLVRRGRGGCRSRRRRRRRAGRR